MKRVGRNKVEWLLKIFLLVIVNIVFNSCSNKQDETEKLVTQYLKENLNDFDTYESVKFEKLDTIYTDLFDLYNDDLYNSYGELYYEASGEFYDLNKWRTSDVMVVDTAWTDEEQVIIQKFIISHNLRIMPSNSIDNEKIKQFYYNKLDSCRINFKPKPDEFSILHSYRIKNSNNEKILIKKHFYISKNFDKVYLHSDNNNLYQSDPEE